MSTESDVDTRRTSGLSVLITAVAVVGTLLLAPTVRSAAAPLAPGSYLLEFDGGTVTIDLATDGRAGLVVSDGIVVHLARDAHGRVLDQFDVVTDDGATRVRIHRDDADWWPELTPTTADVELGPRAALAGACVPAGVDLPDGWPNNATVLSAAASELTLSVDGETFDLASDDGVAALCQAAAVAGMPSAPWPVVVTSGTSAAPTGPAPVAPSPSPLGPFSGAATAPATTGSAADPTPRPAAPTTTTVAEPLPSPAPAPSPAVPSPRPSPPPSPTPSPAPSPTPSPRPSPTTSPSPSPSPETSPGPGRSDDARGRDRGRGADRRTERPI